MDKKLGVIVPYRDRYEQLQTFKQTIIPYLKERGINFELIVVEQSGTDAFNRGKLLNIGFLYAKKLRCDYVVFHDVDMLPEDVDYSYSEYPVHLATDLLGEDDTKKEIFNEYFGGVTLFPKDAFEFINGYSNDYWGWGYEDSDLLFRCKVKGLDLDKKEIQTMGTNTSVLKFNGVNAYVRGKNFFNPKREMTIFVSFKPDEIVCNHEKDFDRFSVFSIPGFDFTISYNSFSRYTVEIFNNQKEIIHQYSDIKPNYRTNIAVTINPKFKEIKFYQDGEMISKQSYDEFYPYEDEKYFYLGVGAIDRGYDEHFFKGTINTFVVFERELSRLEIQTISKNQHFGLTQNFGNYKSDFAIKLCYDSKYVRHYRLLDLVGNNHGKIFNCEIVEESVDSIKEITVPYRRDSKFKLLKHEENGFSGTGWKSKLTRYNELKFYNEVKRGYRDISQDGLSNCEFKEVIKSKVDNQIHVIVTL